MRYKNYIFDLYGTLVDINTDEWSAQLWKKMAILYGYYGAAYTFKELGKAYGELVEQEKKAVRQRHPAYTVIDIKIEKVFRALFTRKGVKPKKATVPEVCEVFRCFSTKYIKLYDGVTELLDTIKTNGGCIYLLSNAQRTFTENELNMLGLTPYFDGICISSDEECSKPDSHYFQILFAIISPTSAAPRILVLTACISIRAFRPRSRASCAVTSPSWTAMFTRSHNTFLHKQMPAQRKQLCRQKLL